MNQKYLLIPLESLEEYDDNEYYHLSWIKSRGEIVQSESIGQFIHKTGLKGSDLDSLNSYFVSIEDYRNSKLEMIGI
jgi:hypothetical protein